MDTVGPAGTLYPKPHCKIVSATIRLYLFGQLGRPAQQQQY